MINWIHLLLLFKIKQSISIKLCIKKTDSVLSLHEIQQKLSKRHIIKNKKERKGRRKYKQSAHHHAENSPQTDGR